MNNQVTAVVFARNQKITFNFYRIYKNYGIGYLLLYDSEESDCLICRILDDKELYAFQNTLSTVILKTNKHLTEKNIIVIRRASNISMADAIVNKRGKYHA